MKTTKLYLVMFLALFAIGIPANAQLTVESGTTISIESGTTVDFNGNLINNGTIGGKGTLNATGSYTHNGTLNITIGPNQNTHTTLGVGSGVTISGGNFVVNTDNYTPTSGDNATIITSIGTITGTFSNSSSNNWNSNYDYPNDGDFTVSYDVVLPIELLFFKVEAFEKDVKLKWQTASEPINSGFEIEHSSNGQNWQTIGFVEGKGNTDLKEPYNYIHDRPLIGDNYYRLKENDLDGQSKFSEVRHVLFQPVQLGHLLVYPNPTSSEFHVRILNPNRESVLLNIYNSIGQLVETRSWQSNALHDTSEATYSLEQKDIYIVTVQIGEHLETKKVSVISMN